MAVAAELAPPKLQQYLVDDILRGAAQPSIRNRCLTALLAVVSALAAGAYRAEHRQLCQRSPRHPRRRALTFDLRAKLVEKLHTLGLGYYDRHQVGSITSRVAYDSEVIQSLLQQITGGFLAADCPGDGGRRDAFHAQSEAGRLHAHSRAAGDRRQLVLLETGPPRSITAIGIDSSKQAGMLTGMLSGIRVVKALAQEDREYEAVRSHQRCTREPRGSASIIPPPRSRRRCS